MQTNDKQPKVFLLGASFSTRNMGVSALATGSIKCIKAAFSKADVFIFDYGKSSEILNLNINGKDLLVPLVNIRFSKKLFLENNIFNLILLGVLSRLLPRDLRERIISGNTALNSLNEADVVASVAGGDSFSDIYGLRRFFYVTLPQVLAVLLGKRLVLLPQTIGPFRSALARAVAGFVLSRAEAVYSRDYEGLLVARELAGATGRADNIRFCHDMGFVLDPVRPQEQDALKPFNGGKSAVTVGLNVSGLLFIGGYTRDNMFGLKSDYRELVEDIIRLFIDKKGANVVLIPHVFGTAEHAESDSAACEAFYEYLKGPYEGRLSVVRGEFDCASIKHVIGLCDFFVGSRMHACIAAVSQNVPAVSIAYSRKFYGVMESIGLESCVADPRELGREEVIAMISRNFDNREELKKGLEQTMPLVRESVLGLFKEIKL